jgi:NADPH:quinone reductase-like Zn-dependent oxidoreductase
MRTEHHNGAGTGTASPTIAMQAVIHDEYGEAEDVLRLATIGRPEIADGEVLVRVHAAGVDRGVWHVVAGLPYALRLAGYGVRKPKNPVAGRDVAGTVEAVGKDVTRFAPGQEVYGTAEGSFAEYARADQGRLAPKPANVTFAQAAALPISGLTALQGLRDRGRVRPGQQVLVIGASGGVGTYAVQIAVALGATVTAVCSPAKADLVRALGAEHVIDYTHTGITAGPRRYDVVLDIGGHRSLGELRRALTPRGTLVIVGSETGGRWFGGFDRSLRAGLLSPFVGHELRMLANSENTADLVALAGLVESGAVTPAIDRTYPLAQAPAAVQYMAHGHARGKVVITV